MQSVTRNMGTLRCNHRYRSSSLMIVITTALSLATLLLSCSTLEASFLPSPIATMRRTVGRQQLPPSLLAVKGGSENGDEESNVTPVPPPPSEPEVTLEDVAPAAATTATTLKAKGKPGWFRRSFPHLNYHKFPDYLTFARCAAIPLLCWTFYTPHKYGHIACGVLFASASVTDWLDGFLARRWSVSTSFGAFLDPVADKLMVSTALILLSGRHGAIVALPTCVILARELAVSALREWMAQRGQRDTVQVGMQGKVKTALTMVALTLMLLVPEIGAASAGGTAAGSWLGNLFLPSLAALYGCALLTVTSGAVYFRAAAPYLMESSS